MAGLGTVRKRNEGGNILNNRFTIASRIKHHQVMVLKIFEKVFISFGVEYVIGGLYCATKNNESGKKENDKDRRTVDVIP